MDRGTGGPGSIVRSVVAVIAGYVVALLFVVAYFAIRGAVLGADAPPGTGGAVVSLLFGLAGAVAAGWVTARLAPSDPMRHAVRLIALSLVVGILFTWVFPRGTPEEMALEPVWTRIGNLLVVIAGVPIGARLAIGAAPGTRS